MLNKKGRQNVLPAKIALSGRSELSIKLLIFLRETSGPFRFKKADLKKIKIYTAGKIPSGLYSPQYPIIHNAYVARLNQVTRFKPVNRIALFCTTVKIANYC